MSYPFVFEKNDTLTTLVKSTKESSMALFLHLSIIDFVGLKVTIDVLMVHGNRLLQKLGWQCALQTHMVAT